MHHPRLLLSSLTALALFAAPGVLAQDAGSAAKPADAAKAAPAADARKAPPAKAAAKNPVVVIQTSLGTLKAELDQEKAPLSVKNFLEYVDAKHYDGTLFHRVIDGFMVQGGGYDEKMKEKKARAPIKNEASNGLKNSAGTLAMARTMDPDSASAQFFINVVDNNRLDYRDPSPQGIGYAVFGRVTEGMDVVNKIKAVPTGTQAGMRDVPQTPVVIQSIRRDKK